MRRFVPYLIVLLSGPLIWFAHFSLLYGLAGFGGYIGLTVAGVRILSWGATLLAGAAAIAILWRMRREPIAAGLAALSLAAIIFQALVLWIIP
jgi:hypothetical protein